MALVRSPLSAFLVLAVASIVGVAPGVSALQSEGDQEPVPAISTVDELRAWIARFGRKGGPWKGADAQLRVLANRLGDEVREEPDRSAELCGLLLDLAGWNIHHILTRDDFAAGNPLRVVHRAGYEVLLDLVASRPGERILEWLADEVLVLPGRHSASRRYVALGVLNEYRTDKARMAMLTIARNEQDELRPTVLSLLATWPEESIDLFLVGLLRKKHDPKQKPHPFNLVLKRVRDSEEPFGPRAADALVKRLAYMLISADWRDASRAIELARGLVLERRVPLLLDALLTWHKRDLRGGGNKRILHEIIRELRRISGRSIGENPKNWITWWIAYRQGRVEVPIEGEALEEQRTHATFFGLGAVSDRITFVIDHSGSMLTEWGTTGHNRYEEAIEQMTRFIQASGAATRFNVILFSGIPVRSSPQLVRADTETLELARSSLLALFPRGATNLHSAVRLALFLDEDGDVDVDRLEADTIIVLCDGETTEGPGWVRTLLERVSADARVVFHCVHLGSRDDGTLRLLAEETGGEYIQIGG
ncbi:MAG: VWA domain-containing protein [Planctomycetota bacterium]|nr:MAG: VWA domain-containing protein [Planctomycetota bacterium]